ncbi:MAG: TadE family type IV pilus minor pilin [Actinomycetota bacterium]
MALPALVVVLGAGMWGLGLASLQARCTTAARSAALAAARGERAGAIAEHVRAAVGADAVFQLSRSGSTVTARVTGRRTAAGLLPALPVSAVAVAELEPTGRAP